MVQPNSTFNVNQFSITPILANHGDNYHLDWLGYLYNQDNE